MIGQAPLGANVGPSISGKHDSTIVARARLTLSCEIGILDRSPRPVSNPYIIPISTSYSGPAATVSTSWPGLQDIGSTLREISHNDWQPSTQDQINISASPASQLSYSASAISPYASEFSTFPPSIDNTDLWSYSPQFPQSGNLAVPTQETPNIYPSPRSERSERAGSLCPVMPANLSSPGQATSPTTDVSQLSRRASTSNTSPPRNLQGQMSCSHPECARQPPTFSRKCEWTLVVPIPAQALLLLTHDNTESTWTSTRVRTSAPSPAVKRSKASPTQADCSVTSAKSTNSMAAPKCRGCVPTVTVNAAAEQASRERRTSMSTSDESIEASASTSPIP